MDMCGACITRKKELKAAHRTYVERSGERLALDTRVFDDIDREAFLQLQMQNLTYPVEVDIKTDEE